MFGGLGLCGFSWFGLGLRFGFGVWVFRVGVSVWGSGLRCLYCMGFGLELSVGFGFNDGWCDMGGWGCLGYFGCVTCRVCAWWTVGMSLVVVIWFRGLYLDWACR